MELAANFVASARGGDCASPVFACAPAYAHLADALSAAQRAAWAGSVDVLGAACGAAAIAGAKRVELQDNVPAWGVADVCGRWTLCLWDGATVWAQGARGAARLKRSQVAYAWSLE